MLYEVIVKILRWGDDEVTERRVVLADSPEQVREYASGWFSNAMKGDFGYGEFFATSELGVAWKVESIKPVSNFMVEDIRDNGHDKAVVYYRVAGPSRYKTEEE